MIRKGCFQDKWIRSKGEEIKADPILIERVIFAFELLGFLIKNNIKLVFKGGTSLILVVPGFKRLSIDLDICTEAEGETLKKTFSNITNGEPFLRWEEDRRTLINEVPKRHFKFFYNSPIAEQELYVLLDILIGEPSFSSIIETPILHPFFEVEEKVSVSVPSINCLAGDKLTAFAPRTIGILFGAGKSMEIIKQLFDLGILFEYISDLEEIRDTYLNIAKLASQYRGLDKPVKAFLDDSIDAAFLLCQSGFKGCIENDNMSEIRDGIRKIKSHVLGGKYSSLQAKTDASKVACLASLIRDERLDVDIKEIRKDRRNLDMIRDINLTDNYSILNKLKKISPESFYLWAVVNRVI